MPAQLREALGKAMEKPVNAPAPSGDLSKDEFFSSEDLVPVKRNAAERTLRRILAEVEELIRENKWEDIVALCDPVAEKHAELTAYGLDVPVRAKLGFAFSQLNRFDEAIRELSVCVKREPGQFMHRSSLAFSAYNSLFAAANHETFLSGKARAERIELAHRHFRKAQELRPDGVTNFYRQGMLFKKIQDKPESALPLFEKAVSNWEKLDQPQKKVRHQERWRKDRRFHSGTSGQDLSGAEQCPARP